MSVVHWSIQTSALANEKHLLMQLRKRLPIASLSHETSLARSISLADGTGVEGSGLSEKVNDDDNDESYSIKTSSQ